MSSDRARLRLVEAGAALAAAALIAGCGNAYRPVVTPINPSGPAAQVTSYAVVVSVPSPTADGIVTIVDYSGDTVMAIASIHPGPSSFVLDQSGAYGYTVNSDGTLANIPISTSLQTKSVTYSTLSASAQPVNLMAPSSGLWAADLNGNVVDLFSSSPQAYKLAIPVAPTPITIAGSPTLSGQREYVISQNFTDATGVACNLSPSTQTTGVATPIEISYNTADSPTIPLGKCPVYAVQSPDLKRLFVMNRGDDTVTVIDTQKNMLDNCTPFVESETGRMVTCHRKLPLSTTATKATGITPPNGTSGMTATAGPVYAEYNSATNQIVVANYDAGTISVIDVTLDEYGNDYNTYANPSCTVSGVTSYANCGAITGGFGTTYTIAVGKNPASVTVLYDGSRAYTANQTDGTVTVADLTSHTVEKTLTVVGHPRTVASTQNSGYSKVYVASPDSPYVTIINATPTVSDQVDTTILVEGNVADLRVTTQNGNSSSSSNSGNSNIVSRTPGRGQPCNRPPTTSNPTPAPTGTQTLLQACQAIP